MNQLIKTESLVTHVEFKTIGSVEGIRHVHTLAVQCSNLIQMLHQDRMMQHIFGSIYGVDWFLEVCGE